MKTKGARSLIDGAGSDAADASQIGNIIVHVEYIEVPKEKLTQYTRDPGFGTDATPLRKEVQNWIVQGDASILETSLITTRSGQRAKVESVRECIYATEWSKSGIPESMETRNEGTTVEVEPLSNGDGSAIALNVTPEIVTLVGETPALPKPEWLLDGDLHIPNFYSIKTTSSIDCVPESYTLLGTKSPHENADTKLVLAFARCGFTRLQTPAAGKASAGQLNYSLEWIEVSTSELGAWLFEQELSAIPSTAYMAAQNWIDNDKASVADLKTIQAKSGQRGGNQSVSEMIYPSHYLTLDEGAFPGGYETRYLGTIVELDSVTRPDGYHVDLVIAPEIIKLMGTFVLHRSQRRSGGPWEPDVTMPICYSMKCSQSATIPEDTPTLLTIMTPPDESGRPDKSRKLLFFVTARR